LAFCFAERCSPGGDNLYSGILSRKRVNMRTFLVALLLLALSGCSNLPRTSTTVYRGDVLYYEDTTAGENGAEEVLRLFGGKQQVAIVDHKLPPAKPPVVVFRVPPEYPANFKGPAVSGEVIVEFIVGESGDVIDAVVVKSLTAQLDEITLAAVKQWKFRPAVREGKHVRSLMQVPIGFGLP
jgi:TonB family protein